MKEIQQLSDEELVHKELSLERELINARFAKSFREKANRNVGDSSVFAKIRKTIARLKTEQTRRQKEQGLPRNGLKMQYKKTFSPEEAKSDEGSENFLQGIADKFA